MKNRLYLDNLNETNNQKKINELKQMSEVIQIIIQTNPDLISNQSFSFNTLEQISNSNSSTEASNHQEKQIYNETSLSNSNRIKEVPINQFLHRIDNDTHSSPINHFQFPQYIELSRCPPTNQFASYLNHEQQINNPRFIQTPFNQPGNIYPVSNIPPISINNYNNINTYIQPISIPKIDLYNNYNVNNQFGYYFPHNYNQLPCINMRNGLTPQANGYNNNGIYYPDRPGFIAPKSYPFM